MRQLRLAHFLLSGAQYDREEDTLDAVAYATFLRYDLSTDRVYLVIPIEIRYDSTLLRYDAAMNRDCSVIPTKLRGLFSHTD